MSWQAIAEQAAKRRAEAIIARIAAVIASSAPQASTERAGMELRVCGRGLSKRWIGDAALRFARRMGR